MHVIYVDDERPALENFRFTAAKIEEIASFEMFQDGEEALEFVKNNVVDVAFLDMEMPGIHGLELAKKIKEYDTEIRIHPVCHGCMGSGCQWLSFEAIYSV